jgi:hypothetical protein
VERSALIIHEDLTLEKATRTGVKDVTIGLLLSSSSSTPTP